jgi:hypothetical protein
MTSHTNGEAKASDVKGEKEHRRGKKKKKEKKKEKKGKAT